MRGSIQKRGKDRWRLVFDLERDHTGKRRQRVTRFTGSKKEAEAKLRELISETENGGFIEPSRLTVAEYLEKWLASVDHSLASTTIERYSQVCHLHIIPVLGDVRLQKLQPLAIQNFLTQCRESGLSKRSALHIHRIFKLALRQAIGWHLIPSNPMEGVAAPTPDKPEIEILDKDETAKLLKVAEGLPIYPIILLAVTTGMRRGELLALRWSDIDFENGYLDVNQALVSTRKYGLEIKAPKSKAGKRRISLPQITINELRRHRNEQAEEFLKLGFRPGNDDTVFLTFQDDGTVGPRSPGSLSKAFAAFVENVDVPRITLHGLRHSHITHLLMDGQPINAVSKRAGHSTVSITLDVYGHVLKENQRDIADSYGRALEQALAEQG